MKVKKFRIKPRLPVVGKILKALMGVKKLSPELEESLPQEISDFTPHMMPTAFYHTWHGEEIPPSFQDVLSSSGFGKAIGVSALVATIGSQPEEYLSDILMKGETIRSQVVSAVGEESADLSFAFLFRLLMDEAKEDDCDVSDPVAVNDPEILSETLSLLEADQEGVTLDSALHLSPRFTRVALAAWWPVSKRKSSLSAQKKKSN